MTDLKCDYIYKHKYIETKEEFIEKSIHNLKVIYKIFLYENYFAKKIIGKEIIPLTQNSIIHNAINILERR